MKRLLFLFLLLSIITQAGAQLTENKTVDIDAWGFRIVEENN